MESATVAVVTASVKAAATARAPARAVRTSGASARISKRHPSCLSVRSRSVCVRARPGATPCSPTSPRSSDRSPSWRCRACRLFAHVSRKRTRSSKQPANRRCRRHRSSRWPRTCCRSCALPNGSTGPRPRSVRWNISTCATCAASSPPARIRTSRVTSRPGRSPRTSSSHWCANRKKSSRCGSATSTPPSVWVGSSGRCVCRRNRPRRGSCSPRTWHAASARPPPQRSSPKIRPTAGSRCSKQQHSRRCAPS